MDGLCFAMSAVLASSMSPGVQEGKHTGDSVSLAQHASPGASREERQWAAQAGTAVGYDTNAAMESNAVGAYFGSVDASTEYTHADELRLVVDAQVLRYVGPTAATDASGGLLLAYAPRSSAPLRISAASFTSFTQGVSIFTPEGAVRQHAQLVSSLAERFLFSARVGSDLLSLHGGLVTAYRRMGGADKYSVTRLMPRVLASMRLSHFFTYLGCGLERRFVDGVYPVDQAGRPIANVPRRLDMESLRLFSRVAVLLGTFGTVEAELEAADTRGGAVGHRDSRLYDARLLFATNLGRWIEMTMSGGAQLELFPRRSGQRDGLFPKRQQSYSGDLTWVLWLGSDIGVQAAYEYERSVAKPFGLLGERHRVSVGIVTQWSRSPAYRQSAIRRDGNGT